MVFKGKTDGILPLCQSAHSSVMSTDKSIKFDVKHDRNCDFVSLICFKLQHSGTTDVII